MYSVLIRNGRIIDGAGNPWFHGDIALQGDTISAIGQLGGAAAGLVVDAGGLAVAPGFIDIHTHSDGPLLVEGNGQSHIRQGVTTNVIGNCGTSLAPVTDRAVEYLKPQRVAEDPDMVWDWRTLGEFLARLERQGVSINVAPLVGHGSVRGSVMGFADRPPTDRELADMKEMVAGAEDAEVGVFAPDPAAADLGVAPPVALGESLLRREIFDGEQGLEDSPLSPAVLAVMVAGPMDAHGTVLSPVAVEANIAITAPVALGKQSLLLVAAGIGADMRGDIGLLYGQFLIDQG